MSKDYHVDLWGNAAIKEGVTEAAPNLFGKSPAIRTVTVPGSVKVIRGNAFADCTALGSIQLSEGIEEIGSWAFKGCRSLKRLVIPDSVTTMDGRAFWRDTGLEEPVYNASGTILYYCPPAVAGSKFVVPEGVKKICWGAFHDCTDLKEVCFPESLEWIEKLAFASAGLEQIQLPKGMKLVEPSAFFCCKNLKTVVAGNVDAIAMGAFGDSRVTITCDSSVPPDKIIRAMGGYYLLPQRVEMPEHAPQFIKKRKIQLLIRRCSQADADAMFQLSQAFRAAGEEPFFQYAANFWLYRAYRYGCTEAAAPVREWFRSYGVRQIPSLLSEDLTGNASGAVLNALGFSFFDPKESGYHIEGPDKDGVYLVSIYDDEDGPDEDGFGREIYYNWWYLDSCLNYYPEYGHFHSYSYLDKRNNESRFQALRDKVAKRGVTPRK